MKRIANERGVSLSLHVPYTLNPADTLGLIRAANVEYLRKCIALASAVRATHVTTHIGYCNGLPSWQWLRQEALERLIDSLRSVLPLCRRKRVVLALENVNPMPRDSEFFYLGDSMDDLTYVFQKLPSACIRLCLDVGHANTNEGPLEYVKRFGKKIVAVHYHDNTGKHDQHVAVGRGTIPWAKLGRAFHRIGFRGPFVSEVFSRSACQSRDDFRKFLI